MAVDASPKSHNGANVDVKLNQLYCIICLLDHYWQCVCHISKTFLHRAVKHWPCSRLARLHQNHRCFFFVIFKKKIQFNLFKLLPTVSSFSSFRSASSRLKFLQSPHPIRLLSSFVAIVTPLCPGQRRWDRGLPKLGTPSRRLRFFHQSDPDQLTFEPPYNSVFLSSDWRRSCESRRFIYRVPTGRSSSFRVKF